MVFSALPVNGPLKVYPARSKLSIGEKEDRSMCREKGQRYFSHVGPIAQMDNHIRSRIDHMTASFDDDDDDDTRPTVV